MCTIKDRNDNDPTEPEEIKKRWQEYTEELRFLSFSDRLNDGKIIYFLIFSFLKNLNAYNVLDMTLSALTLLNIN